MAQQEFEFQAPVEAGEGFRLSGDQRRAVAAVRRWLDSRGWDARELAMGGLAGTGKTTIVGSITRQEWLADWVVVYLAPTGKAAATLRSKGIYTARTVHSFLYKHVGWKANARKGVDEPVFAYRGADEDATLIVVDEASMVDQRMADDLRAQGCKVLWIGDHGQLPPVGGDPGIMERPAVALEQVHRQVAGSGILRLAYHVRLGGELAGEWGDDVDLVRGSLSRHELAEGLIEDGVDQVIVATHRTRLAINEAWRAALERRDQVEEGERLVCLRNTPEVGAMNGQTFRVDRIVSDRGGDQVVADLTSLDDGREFRYVPLWRGGFAQRYAQLRECPDTAMPADYGYAITCHKAQGSEWPHVAVVDDGLPPSWDAARWRYTACTRAAERLTVLRGRVR